MTGKDSQENSPGNGAYLREVAWLILLWVAIVAWISPLAGVS